MPAEARFADVCRMLTAAGYELARISGSHHVFTKPGRDPISIPVHKNKVKPVYVRKVQQIIEAERAREGGEGR
jgi:predicted RNA binding protein YcfA (HicA-like mRNA interferase family)